MEFSNSMPYAAPATKIYTQTQSKNKNNNKNNKDTNLSNL